VEWPAFEAGEPSAGGIMRPVLHGILSRVTRSEGVGVRLGVTATGLQENAAAVAVSFSDGVQAEYDLVIAADGVNSSMRERVFPGAPKPKFSGQSVYRIVVERPAGLDGSRFFPLGDRVLGCSLVSATHMYMFLLLPMPGNPRIAPQDQPQHLYDNLAGWGGFVPQIREQILHSPVRETVNYRPLEPVLQPAPWHKGRVLLIGDAAHATTPHMASGAGMAVEDGLVIAEEVGRGGDLPAVFARYMQRRYQRCRTVVENSVRLGEMELRGESPIAHNALVKRTIAELTRPM
jgi:2-polyprenyl-6-methoxyphenol hydroxylase-like FAD-dependent oxidoreductase